MYYESIKTALTEHCDIDLIYLGVKYEINSLEGKTLAVMNCADGTQHIFGSFEEMLDNNATIYTALHEEDYNKVWFCERSERSYADPDEFMEHLGLGSEIEFIFHGMGYFIWHTQENGKAVWKVHNACKRQVSSYPSKEDMLLDKTIFGKPFKDCILDFEIIAYM